MYTSRNNQRVNQAKRSREDRTLRPSQEDVNKHYSSNTISHFKSHGTSGTGAVIPGAIEIFLSTGRIPDSYSSMLKM
ncbi:hypothetical protein AAJ76_1760003434 [Vairimorpha ceranae]|uniref:Uncharacterized protein n=1 Tax=Vairimorpha ceranae TaxID=40302 RepID=A0A0F9WLG0_9MICR|nr:hypothetical protein AAJ76_1760003434 [Vairimorpha ceranae]KKO73918.1 hypothetical protein AAJ76_1760003434 [Vairimorpha ceranae]